MKKKHFNISNYALYFLALFAISSLSAFHKNPIENTPLVVVKVRNVQHREGNIIAVVYNRDNFLTEKYLVSKGAPAQADSAEIVFQKLPKGSYAIAIYHDTNANDYFDRNWFGYPKEPFAISNNLRPFNLMMPSFDKAKFDLNNSSVNLTIDLLNN